MMVKHSVTRFLWGPGAVLAAVACLAFVLSACSSDPKYYDYNPQSNSNDWPYKVRYGTTKISYDQDAGVLRIQGVYKPLYPVSNCADPKGPLRVVHEIPVTLDLDKPFGVVHVGDAVQYVDASPITEEQFDQEYVKAVHDPFSDLLAIPVQDATLWFGTGPNVRQSASPPYSILCGSVGAAVSTDASPPNLSRHVRDVGDGPDLLCGTCGESRCGDGICDPTKEDATSCWDDCEPRWY
ncbi:MAG: hypothetical protein J7M25_14015 [Deltaproteobacteria bacterium]|nr:hypothetical protein [Deltaproteobacteria bacterium]